MKKTICFYFQVHTPFNLRHYRFFDIGNSHYYYDDFHNNMVLSKITEKSYLPMNKLLLELIKEYGDKFKVTFSITGESLEMMELYSPQTLKSFQDLAETGCIEFLAETYSHSFAFLKDIEEFKNQINKQVSSIKKYFGQEPKIIRLSELVYSDRIGEEIAKMGFEAMLTEGAKHVLGWKSPNYLYNNANNKDLKILLRNYILSDDIALRFSNKSWKEWPLSSEKYITWLDNVGKNDELINLFMDYTTFGISHSKSTGIFEFVKYLYKNILDENKFELLTPSEVIKKHNAVATVYTPYTISWSQEERDLSAWLGNDLQSDAFNSLYELADKMKLVEDKNLLMDWSILQDSNHYIYMCTKDISVQKLYKNPYSSPYEAYINYMNVLGDFIYRVNDHISKKETISKPKDLIIKPELS